MPQKPMECFKLLFDHLAWIKHQFLSGIRDSRKAGSLWGMMRGVGGVKEVRTPELIGQIKNFMDKDLRVSIETINAQFDVSVGTVHTIIHEELKMRKICVEVCPKGAQRRSERKTLSWQHGDGRADQFRSRSSWCSGDLRWKLDLLLWPRDQETELPVEACWLSQTQEGQTEQITPTKFWWSLFLTALAWSTCTGFPLDRQSTRNTMLRF